MRPYFLALLFSALAACTRAPAAESPEPPAALPAAGVEEPMDRALADRLRTAILGDRELAPHSGALRVECRAGVVTLSGFVASAAHEARAVTLVRAAGGVVRVDDRLVVDAVRTSAKGPMESELERTISDRVRWALREDRTVAAEAAGLEITTRDGVVQLRGSVGSRALEQRIVVVARAVGSVRRVDDQLTLRGP